MVLVLNQTAQRIERNVLSLHVRKLFEFIFSAKSLHPRQDIWGNFV